MNEKELKLKLAAIDKEVKALKSAHTRGLGLVQFYTEYVNFSQASTFTGETYNFSIKITTTAQAEYEISDYKVSTESSLEETFIFFTLTATVAEGSTLPMAYIIETNYRGVEIDLTVDDTLALPTATSMAWEIYTVIEDCEAV